MTIYTSMFGKANVAAKQRTVRSAATCAGQRLSSSATAAAPRANGQLGSGKVLPRVEDSSVQRELFMNVLGASATKRDAKQFLSRFKRSSPQIASPRKAEQDKKLIDSSHQEHLERTGVNLGKLYAPGRAIADSPQFAQHRDVLEKQNTPTDEVLHVALICLKAPGQLDDQTLDGLALTLSQLVKLDMRIVLVISEAAKSAHELRKVYAEQGERICKAISRHSPDAARFTDSALETAGSQADQPAMVSVGIPELVFRPVERGMIPVVPCLAFSPLGNIVDTQVTEVMKALTMTLSGLRQSDIKSGARCLNASLDRIIILDPVGGIPSKARGDGSHVFINLEQEFDPILAELDQYSNNQANGADFGQHEENLRMLQACLAELPAASSSLIISPQDAAASSNLDDSAAEIGAGTRRQKNTLIHNLLTNKPIVSSSLPVARLSANTAPVIQAATLVKRGMPVKIIPSASREQGWLLPQDGHTSLDITADPRIDFPQLLHLIENSFRRKLNVDHYMQRIRGRIAGVIVAGHYEGGAILTWEQPPGSSDPQRLVPYLDKFAVLQSSQGSSGVADILFQAMVRSCFPQGVCWRSRKDNPVNKWYFERAAGTWRIPETNWTMFWTGERVVEDEERFMDYVNVCREVVPSFYGGRED